MAKQKQDESSASLIPPDLFNFNDPRRRKRIRLWALAISASALFLVLGIMWMEPAPPKSITLATGGKTGAYYSFGKKYANALGKSGLRVRVLNSKGSVQNIRWLLEGKVDVAFVQGGVSPPESMGAGEALGKQATGATVGEELASIAAIYFEPLWVFYRGPKTISILNQLRGSGKDAHGQDLPKGGIAVGAEGSGTLALARELLERNGVTPDNTRFAYLNAARARAALEAGDVDAAMFVTSHHSQDVRQLLKTPGVKLMSFRRHVAYVRSIPYLDRIDLSQGILDLQADSPPSDAVLLAPAATLVCRRSTHPMVVQRFLTVARKLHSGRGLMNKAGRFPNADLIDLPLHEAAETFFVSGMPATGWVPFWLVRLAFKLKLLALPLITLLLPFAKLGSVLWVFRIRQLIRRHYSTLKRIEAEFAEDTSPERLQAGLAALDSLRERMASLSRGVPSTYQDQIYHWRVHVAMVKDEFKQRLKEAQGAEGRHESDTPPEAQPAQPGPAEGTPDQP